MFGILSYLFHGPTLLVGCIGSFLQRRSIIGSLVSARLGFLQHGVHAEPLLLLDLALAFDLVELLLERLDLVLDGANPGAVSLLPLGAPGTLGLDAPCVKAVRPSYVATDINLAAFECLLDLAGPGDASPGVMVAAKDDASVETHGGGREGSKGTNVTTNSYLLLLPGADER